MPDHSPTASLDSVEVQAGQVRDYLVAIRGGAPFLSARDDHLLLGWLEDGLAVPCILAAIDDVAIQRRRKRAKSRLTLTACKKAVEKSRGQPLSGTPEAQPAASMASTAPASTDTAAPAHPGLAQLATDLSQWTQDNPLDSPALHQALDQLILQLQLLSTRKDHIDAVGRAAAAAVTDFHAAAWEAAAHEHDDLRDQASVRLQPIKAMLRGSAWTDMIEEVARDLVRQRTPLVSARQVWDRLTE